MKKVIATAIFAIASAVPALAQDYDLVILNGRVMDPETMLDAKLHRREGRFMPPDADCWTRNHAILNVSADVSAARP
jgi:hypothetical protein